MHINNLNYLLEIARAGSINKAAKNLFMSHSSLMYLLQSIEKELGYKIFERSKQGVVPTIKGLTVLEGAAKILDIAKDWYNPTNDINILEGSITITLVPVAAQILGRELLVSLRESYPMLDVTFNEQRISYTDISLMLSILQKSNSKIYIGSMCSNEKSSFENIMKSQNDLEYYLQDIDEMILYVSQRIFSNKQSNFITPEDALKLPTLYYPDSSLQKFGYDEILDMFSQKQTYKMSTSNFMLELVSKGLAVLLGSWLATKDSPEVKSGHIESKRIKNYPMIMTYYILFPSSDRISNTEKIVVNVIKNYFNSLVREKII